MDNKYRLLLKHHQQDIVRDLDVEYIIDELFQKNVITNDILENIYNLTNRGERSRYVIDTILQNGNNATYQAFVDSLSKDYHWLWEKFNVEYNEPMLNNSFEDSLSKGDVPRLPDHYVQRAALEEKVVSKLEQLARHKVLALHGMPGSGKTSVAVGALRYNPDLINNNFKGAVFWLDFGNCKTQDDVINQQTKLYRKASSVYSQNSFMNSSISMSSIGSNADTQSFSSFDWTSQDLRDKLKSQFQDQALKEALLVLDEVNEKKYLEAFDIGCKILITTRDTDVVDNFQAQIIKIGNNFEEKESLKLFASCLDVEPNELPRQARKLHDICKGNPFSIAMLGAILSENRQRLTHDTNRWSYYVNKLQKKDFLFLPRHDNPIKVFINALDSTLLPLFKMLAILPDNAKFSAKVISRLWDKDVPEVESIMKQLRKKCLIIEEYIQDQRNYLYEVHDLIMDCLRTSLSDDEKKKLHAEFLQRYKYNATTAPVEIEDDGYMAYYIGYHLHNTKNFSKMWSLFNKLYLDLKFLGNKVKLTGPADVILDLQKYEALIVEDGLDKDLLQSLKAFLSTHGTDLYRYPSTVLVQSILQQESKGILYNKASAIAAEYCAKNELYFEFLHEQNVDEIKHSTIDVKETIRCVCFLGDFVLVGTHSGSIKMFNIASNNLKKELPSNGSPVKWLGVCPVNPFIVAALAFDGSITLWYPDDVEQDDTDRIMEEEEEAFNNNYPSKLSIPLKAGPFINCRWANYTETLITHTAKMVILYDSSGVPTSYSDLLERDRELLCCVPSNDDRYLIMATSGSSNYVEVVDLTTKEKVMSFEENETVMDILTVPGTNRIIILMQTEILEHELQLNGGSYQNNFNICRSRSVITSELVRSELTFLSIAVNKAGSLLFVSTDDSRVICIDLKNLSRIFDLENRRGNVISMAVSEVWYDFLPGSDVLLTGTGTIENSAKVWQLDPSYVSQNTQKNGKVRLTTKFDVSFVDTLSPHTPTSTSGAHSSASTPKRIKSFVNHSEPKKPIVSTRSLDRQPMKPVLSLNLKGLRNGNDAVCQPLLAVVDDNNNIQIMRGRKLITEIVTKTDEKITALKISPCNQYIIYGLPSGSVKRYTLRTKDTKVILDVNSPVQYLDFVRSNLLVVAGKNRCLMAYRLTNDGTWMPEMLQKGNCHLGSQEILNDINGMKHKNGQSDRLSNSSSESSVTSKERLFPAGDNRGCLSEASLVNCFWLQDRGLITVENNATVKLWDQNCLSKSPGVLNGRQLYFQVNYAAFQKNILVLCDEHNKKFQTFEVKDGENVLLQTIQEYKLNNRITSCDLTSDGYILAMGLDSGDVVLWNVERKRQLRLLKHHKAKVQWCAFSPVPDRLFRSSNLNSPSVHAQSNGADDDQPPLVLVTMAAEIVWWDITYLMRTRPVKNIWRQDLVNVVTPLVSPLQPPRSDLPGTMENMTLGPPTNFFFREGIVGAKDCWMELWKNKTYKEGSKRKEILACIKLSGMYAKKLCFDDKFSCFVTVDNPGHIHIMKVMAKTYHCRRI